jgi:hypothetical protein
LGYGVSRQLPVPYQSEPQEQAALQRLAPLFNPRVPVIGTGFADIFDRKLARTYASLLHEALIKSGLLPRVTALELRGRGGVASAATLVESHRFELRVGPDASVRLPAVWLSQGYQAMITWVADLVGHAVAQEERRVALKDIQGLVLVDELDLFLHPRWQVNLIEVLRRTFPRVQFIATTHSPMLLPGLTREELFLLTQTADGDVVITASPADPRLMTGSELYAMFFDIDKLRPTDVGELLQRYVFLANDPFRSDAAQREVLRLRDRLAAQDIQPGFDPVPRRGLDKP